MEFYHKGIKCANSSLLNIRFHVHGFATTVLQSAGTNACKFKNI